MPNTHLQCHCITLVTYINTFKHTIDNCKCRPDHKNYRAEQKYYKKLDKQLNVLLKLLGESP